MLDCSRLLFCKSPSSFCRRQPVNEDHCFDRPNAQHVTDDEWSDVSKIWSGELQEDGVVILYFTTYHVSSSVSEPSVSEPPVSEPPVSEMKDHFLVNRSTKSKEA